jgi:cytochrome o ubiquinol oxidase subunit IV
MNQLLTMRITGFVASLVLTLIAYYLIVSPELFHLDVQSAIVTIFGLALAQSLVQLIFFIDVWKEKGPLWNLWIFLSTLPILFVIIYFSIWIMNHLNDHMR